jgi:hypothetical protein
MQNQNQRPPLAPQQGDANQSVKSLNPKKGLDNQMGGGGGGGRIVKMVLLRVR